jgi:hypothetical protein
MEFLVVNFNVLLANAALQNMLSCSSSKWHGMVMCNLNNVLFLNFLWQRMDQ